MRKNITNQIKAKSKDRFTRFSAAALLASILLLISSALLFAGVINTRQNRIHELGERSIATGNTVAISLRSFQLARLRSLMASPEQNDTFRSVSAYLNEIRSAGKYRAIFLLYRSDSDTLCLCDSRYGANLVADSDYFEPEEPVSRQQFGSDIAELTDAVSSGEKESGFTDSITRSDTFGAVTAACVPVYDDTGGILCSVLILNDASELTAANGFMRPQKIAGAVTLALGLIIAAILAFAISKRKKTLTPYSGEIEFVSDKKLDDKTSYHDRNFDDTDL